MCLLSCFSQCAACVLWLVRVFVCVCVCVGARVGVGAGAGVGVGVGVGVGLGVCKTGFSTALGCAFSADKKCGLIAFPSIGCPHAYYYDHIMHIMHIMHFMIIGFL